MTEFQKFLAEHSHDVDTWPTWKRNVLGNLDVLDARVNQHIAKRVRRHPLFGYPRFSMYIPVISWQAASDWPTYVDADDVAIISAGWEGSRWCQCVSCRAESHRFPEQFPDDTDWVQDDLSDECPDEFPEPPMPIPLASGWRDWWWRITGQGR